MRNRKVEAEERLLRHMRAMGGWIGARLPDEDEDAMYELARCGYVRRTGSGAQDRYVLTAAGEQRAERSATR